MKKIITLLFFAGCLTTGFAQTGHRQQNNTQSNGNGYQSHQSSGNNRNQYSQNSRNSNGDYRDYRYTNRNNQNDYGYNKDNDNQGRGVDQYHYPSDNQRGFEDHSNRSWSKESRHHKMYRDDSRDY
jgi:hypothetical protein